MRFSISSDICRLGPLPEQIFLCNFRGKITEFVKFNSQRRFNLELNNNFKDFRFNDVNSTFRWYFSSKHLSSTLILNWQIAKEPLNSQKFNSDWGLNVELDQDRDWGQFISQSVVWPVVAPSQHLPMSRPVHLQHDNIYFPLRAPPRAQALL